MERTLRRAVCAVQIDLFRRPPAGTLAEQVSLELQCPCAPSTHLAVSWARGPLVDALECTLNELDTGTGSVWAHGLLGTVLPPFENYGRKSSYENDWMAVVKTREMIQEERKKRLKAEHESHRVSFVEEHRSLIFALEV